MGSLKANSNISKYRITHGILFFTKNRMPSTISIQDVMYFSVCFCICLVYLKKNSMTIDNCVVFVIILLREKGIHGQKT